MRVKKKEKARASSESNCGEDQALGVQLRLHSRRGMRMSVTCQLHVSFYF